jgi:hypothetical protein
VGSPPTCLHGALLVVVLGAWALGALLAVPRLLVVLCLLLVVLQMVLRLVLVLPEATQMVFLGMLVALYLLVGQVDLVL